jgi:DNA-binding PadR family transcriptional regulator
MQDNGYVKELPTDQSGMKRYELTDTGKDLLEEQRKIKKTFREEASLFPPHFLGALWFQIPPEKTSKVRGSMRRLMAAFFELGADLEGRFSETAVGEAQKALDAAAEKLEKIHEKLKGEHDE